MKRKIFFTLILFAIIILLNLIFTNQNVLADTYTDSYNLQWYYDVENDKAVNVHLNSSYTGQNNNVLKIPETMNGYPVTELEYKNYTGTGILGYSTSYRTSIEKVEIPSTVTKIGHDAFKYFRAISSIEMPETVVEIGANAFEGCSNMKNFNLPNSLKKIDNSAFKDSAITGNLMIPETVEYIGEEAFKGCSGLTGNLNIPNSVTFLGAGAFKNCKNLNGILTVGTGITDILSSVFSNTKFQKVNLGQITSLGYLSFEGYEDIWVNNEKDNVTLNSYGVSGIRKDPIIHWKNGAHTHKLEIQKLDGIKLINIETGEEVLSGDYNCETSFRYRLVVDSGYDYQNLQIVVINNNEIDKYESIEENDQGEYEFKTLTRDRKILVQNLSSRTDFALRTFITEVNRNSVPISRVPVMKLENGTFNYYHTKNPVSVKKGDLVTFKVRVYNEAIIPSKAKKIAVHIPEGFEYVKDNRTNISNNWEYESGLAVTSKFENDELSANLGNGTAKYKDLEIVLKVTLEKNSDQNTYRSVFAEVYESDRDEDSVPGNINITSYSDYRTEELLESDNTSYIRCGEDDEDFDTVFMRGKVKVDYNIVVNKIDGDTREVLEGAKFNLLDVNGNVLATVESDKDGIVDFAGLTTYGDGTDIYYIQEVQTPDGYYLTDNKKVRVTVTKTIINEEKGLYSLKVTCDTLSYNIDTTRYDFTPVYTVDQLRKIGSGEIVEIDGVKYEYNINTNYKLMNDIILEGEDALWTPINRELKCIIDGNGHKISGLTITGDKLDKSEIGLFSVFSGIIENLELENVNISFNNFEEDAETTTGKTGVGSFVGVMKEGYLVNCKASGVISTYESNIGGFVGHTLGNGIVKVENCENNINIEGRSQANNVGGIIGCAIGSVSFNNSINNGKISAPNTNCGGMVGYVDPSEYQELNINTAYDEDNKILNLLVENFTTTAEYKVHLQDIDIDTEEALLGGVYTVYDGGKNILDNMEHLELDEIMKKIVEKQLRAVGLDTYYIVEEQPVKGYEPINGIVRLDVERYWDDDEKCYKFRIMASVISDIVYEEAEPNLREEKPIFDRGDIFTDVLIEKANMNSEKAEFVNCINNGEILEGYINSAGIVGAVHGYTYIENCENTANIRASRYGRAAGIISELYAFHKTVEIKGCKNSGLIESYSNKGSAGGIVANVIANLNISDCINNGQIKASSNACVSGGIIADATGVIYVRNCKNNGEIFAAGEPYNTQAGGIIGKVMVDLGERNRSVPEFMGLSLSKTDSIVEITECTNTGNIKSYGHEGGIIGYDEGYYIKITHCSNENCSIDDIGSADKGGIAGYLGTQVTYINNCTVSEAVLQRLSSAVNTTYGVTGGILGNCCHYGNRNGLISYLEIQNCIVENCDISTKGQSTGGILGGILNEDSFGTMVIRDCLVKECEVINKETLSTYTSSGGIFAMCRDMGTVIVENCAVLDSYVASLTNNSSSDQNVGGLIGTLQYAKTQIIRNNDVKNLSIKNNSNYGDGCANTSGLVAFVDPKSYGSNTVFVLENCNVEKVDITNDAGNNGGIIGCVREFSRNDAVILNNNKVSDIEFYTDTRGLGGNATMGGVVGYMAGKINFINCTVDNIKMNYDTPDPSTGSGVAGFIGIVTRDSSYTGCSVKNLEIISKGAYGNNACISGFVGFSMSPITFNACSVENSILTGDSVMYMAPSAGNIGAMVGACIQKITINNSKVKDCDLNSNAWCVVQTSNSSVGGAIGQSSSVEINEFEISDCNISGPCMEMSAVVGGAYNEAKFENIEVSNININDFGFVSGYNLRSIGGIIASAGSDFYAKNISVDNLSVTSETISGAGIAGSVYSIKQLEDIHVNNFNITNNNAHELKKYNGSVAGLIGDVYAVDANKVSDLSVKNSKIITNCNNASGLIATVSSGITLEDVVLENVVVKNNNERPTEILGAVAGMLTYCSSKVIGNNITINNLELEIGERTNSLAYSVGGLLSYGYNADFDNVSLKDVNIKNKTFGIAGGLVGMSDSTTSPEPYVLNVSNLDFDNVNVTSNSHSATIIGLSNKVNISDSNIQNSKAYSSDVCGILVGLPHTRSDNTITVTNTDIKSSEAKSSQQVGGVVGFIQADIDVNGMTLDNLNLESLSNCSGAVAGNVQQKFIGKNITVQNNTVIKSGAQPAGGLIGYTKGNELENITVTNTEIITEGGFAGGIIGGTDGNINANNVKVQNDVDINARTHVGGIVGYANGTAKFENPTLKNITITSDSESAGGIIGILNGTIEVKEGIINTIDVTAPNVCAGIVGSCSTATVSDTAISNITLKSTDVTRTCLTGGYIGAASDFNITDSSITNSNIEGYYTMGGVLATGKINTDNVTLNGITITMKTRNTYVGNGGLVGIADNGSNIDNVTATNITINSNGVLAGGIAGIAHCNVNDVHISDSNIKQDTFANVGGIAGILDNGKLTNSSVDNCEISGKTEGGQYGDIGGAVGCTSYLGDDIENVTVTNSTITSDEEAGGIIGVANGNIKNCLVDNCTINVVANLGGSSYIGGDAGGIVGTTRKEVSNCTVKNSTISSNKLAGGIVGAGYIGINESTVLKDLIVSNNTLSYGLEEEGTGEYIGAPNLEVESTNIEGLSFNSLSRGRRS